MKIRLLRYLPLIAVVFFTFTRCTPEQDTAITPDRQFVKYYGLSGLDEGVDIKYTPANGGLVILGERNVIGGLSNSIILYTTDSAGNELAKQEIEADEALLYTPRKIVVDPNGGYIIGGTRTDTDLLESYMFTLRVDENLQVDPSWGEGGFMLYGSDTIEFEFNNNTVSRTPSHRLFDLTVHEGGLVIIGGTNDVETNKVNFNPNTDVSDVSVLFLDAQGNVLLSSIYGYPGEDQGHSIIPTGSNNFAVMGVTNRSAFAGNDTQLSGSNILFNLIDIEGQVRQNKVFGSTTTDGDVNVDDAPVVMVQDGLGFAGMANNGSSNAIMIRLTSTGELITLSNLNLAEQSISSSLIRTFRGDYIVTGSVDTPTDTETSVDRGTDMLVMNVNQDFTVNSERVYNYGGEENDVSNGIVQLPSSSLMILGTTDFENGNTMITLMKTNSTGRFITN